MSFSLSLVISICYRMNHCLSAYKAIILVEHFKSRVLVKLKGLIHVTRCSNHASVAKLMVSETTALLPKFHYAMILVTYFILSIYVQWKVFQCFLPCLTKPFCIFAGVLKSDSSLSMFHHKYRKISSKMFFISLKTPIGNVKICVRNFRL